MKMRALLGMLLFCISVSGWSQQKEWRPDILGDGYEMRYVEQPDDYSGAVRSAVVRKLPVVGNGVAVLYLHGYNDYFFQRELGDSLIARRYAFYALELRKYGRSLLPGQRKFEVRDLKEYFEDLDSALAVMKSDGWERIVLMGHSTGGLVLSDYLVQCGGKFPQVKALILNSPFLDMNLNRFQEKFLVPLVSVLPFKNISISQGDSRAYAESLLAEYHGEWSYDKNWKLEVSPSVTSGWISAIHKAQKRLRKNAGISVPVLLMRSDKSVYGGDWTPAFNRGDGVLDVADISKYGKQLGKCVSEFVAADGLHDLILSRRDVRDRVYAMIFSWLESQDL